MNRRAWAAIIIGTLFLLMIVITVTQTDTNSIVNVPTTTFEAEWEEKTLETVGSGTSKIVQLYVDGVIADSDSFSGGFRASSFLSQLNQVMEDQNVEGVIIRVDSPGGTVIDSEEIHAKILELKEAGVTVVVSMGATAASGGYYISAPADFIFASPSTITGSLGVIFSVPNFQKAADWIGYKENTITSGKMKDIGSPLREMTAEERGVFQALVDESYEQFVKVIADGRGLSKAEVLKLADGRIYSGKQAQKLGLVDELGSLEDATAYMVDLLNYDDYRIVRYLEPFSFDSLFQGFITAQDSQTATVLREFFPKVSYEPQLLYLYH